MNNKKPGEAPAVKTPAATFQPATAADSQSGPFKSNAGPSGRPHDNVAPSGGGKVTGALPAAPIQSAQRVPTKPASVPTARPPVAEPAKAAPATVTPSRSSGRPHENVAPSGGTPLTKLELPPAPIQSSEPKKSTPAKAAKSSGRPHDNVAPSGGKPVQSALGQPLTAGSIEST